MATHITQIDDPSNNRSILRVDGEMMREDAELLEKIASQIGAESETIVVIDLAELDLMDSDAAVVLKRMQEQERIFLEGIEMFVQAAVNETERIRH